MKLKFISPNSLDKNLKATVHKTGKLGFTMDAATKLGLNTNKSAAIAINDEDPSDTNLYVIINEDRQEGAFPISKAGQYFYINAKALFDSFKFDYAHDSIVYDITREVIEEKEFYKFKRREKNKKVSNES